MTPGGVDRLLDFQDHPELSERDKLVVEYAIQVAREPRRVRDALFERLRAHFTEAQVVELTLRITLTGFFNAFSEALQVDEESHEAQAAE
jgi:alkylhydroperoxidase family enzyme